MPAKAEDAALIEYCEELRARLAAEATLGEPLRVLLDAKPGKAAAKRWDWVRKGAPLIVEVGSRDMAEGKVAMLRRDKLWNVENGKPAFQFLSREGFSSQAPSLLEKIQQVLFDQARERRDANITRGVTTMEAVAAHFADSQARPGWVEVQWSKPTGAALEAVTERLKEHKLTIRNVPRDSAPADGLCIFTGAPAVERILIARAY